MMRNTDDSKKLEHTYHLGKSPLPKFSKRHKSEINIEGILNTNQFHPMLITNKPAHSIVSDSSMAEGNVDVTPSPVQ